MIDHYNDGFVIYECNGCGANGRARKGDGLPDGWTYGRVGFCDSVNHYCPRCSAKQDAQIAEKEAKRSAKKQAAREAQAAYDATPDGKKERNIAALSAVAAVLLFFLFAGVFHLYFVAFIIGFLAGAPFFWFRARKAGFIFLVIVLLMIMVEINGPDVKNDEANANASQTSEEASTENFQAGAATEHSASPKVSGYLDGVDDIDDSAELSRFYFDIASRFYNNEMGLKGTQEQIDAGNEMMSTVYNFLGRAARKNGNNMDADDLRDAIRNASNVSNFRKKKALEELQLGLDKINEID